MAFCCIYFEKKVEAFNILKHFNLLSAQYIEAYQYIANYLCLQRTLTVHWSICDQKLPDELGKYVFEVYSFYRGGHDHDYGMEKVDGLRGGRPVEKIILKSGTDFRELSAISLHFHADDSLEFEVRIMQSYHAVSPSQMKNVR